VNPPVPGNQSPALLEGSERLAGIIQSAIDAIIIVDEQQRILVFNPAAARVFRCREHEAVGTFFDRFIPQRFRAEHGAAFARAQQNDISARSAGGLPLSTAMRADGEEFSCEASIALHQAGGRREFTIVIRDVTERKQFEDALLRRVAFETFLFELSKTFIGLPDEQVDAHMEEGLARVGEFLQIDRITLLELSHDGSAMTAAYSWSNSGVAAPPAVLTKEMHPWWLGQVLRGDVSLAAHVDDLPDEAAVEREYLRQRGIASAASIPLRVGGEIAGAISFVTTGRHVSWSPALVSELRAIGDILWNALKRHQAMRALAATQALVRDSEERFRLAMHTVAAGVYTIDMQGLVTYMNPAAEVIFGWTMAELLGRKMHDVVHYKHADGTPYPASDCPGFQVLKHGVELREHADLFIRKDGSFFPVVFSASPLKRDGRTLGIVVGFRDDTERREAERAIRESEERFRLIASTVPVIIWMSDVNQQCAYVNESWTTLTGRPREDALGGGWADGIHPDDMERSMEAYAKAFERRESFQLEHRFRTSDAEFRWFFVQATPRYTDGVFAGYIGSAVDVTERKAAEAALSTLSQRLIRAQEQERARLARELHDDINQQLALLGMRLDALKHRSQASAPELAHDIAKAIDAVTALTSDVQSLSHRLHSSKLMLLGLEAAARHLCRELSDRLSIDIHFESTGVVAVNPDDVAVGLYRVLQEALQNAIKHSGSRRIEVQLHGSPHEITLTVQDTGIGFEPNTALSGRGLGLISMKERLKLVDGELRVDTRSPGGTTIRARVPVNPATHCPETV